MSAPRPPARAAPLSGRSRLGPGASGRLGARPRLTGPAGAARSDSPGPARPSATRPGAAAASARLTARPARRVCGCGMSEGESKQVPSGGSDSKPEPASSGPGMTSVSAPVASAAPPEEEEEEESEDESEILEESPCGRWQKRREEVSAGGRFSGLGLRVCEGSPGSCGHGISAGPGSALPAAPGPARAQATTVCHGPRALGHRALSAACFSPCMFVALKALLNRWCRGQLLLLRRERVISSVYTCVLFPRSFVLGIMRTSAWTVLGVQ